MIWRLLICIFMFGLCLYSYINRNNQITELRYALPALDDEILILEEKNTTLRYAIEASESPRRLMELARQPAYCHLHQPRLTEVIEIEVGIE